MKSIIWFFLTWVLVFYIVFIKMYESNDGVQIKNSNIELQETYKKMLNSIGGNYTCLDAIWEPQKIIVNKGEVFTSKLRLGYFIPYIPEKGEAKTVSINGVKYMANEKGIVEFEEKTLSLGARDLNVILNPSSSGGLTGEKFCGGKVYEYFVRNTATEK